MKSHQIRLYLDQYFRVLFRSIRGKEQQITFAMIVQLDIIQTTIQTTSS